MSFADKLVQTPRREKSGETGYERYDYQASWGLALIFESHSDLDDYAIAFEFHDDIVRLDSSPDETVRLSFVSNLPCKFMDASATEICFANCAPEDFTKFLAKLKDECPSATESKAKLLHFVRANLSLHDASAHLKGLMQDFVTSQLGTVSYSPDTLFKAIIEECRTKSKYTGSINTFDDLIRHKAVTKSQVNGWLSQIKISHAVPNWSDFASDLEYAAMEKASIGKEWRIYRTLALGAGNEAINRVRTRIRAELKKLQGSSLELAQLTDQVLSKVWSFGKATISDLTAIRAKVMIIYEVMTYQSDMDERQGRYLCRVRSQR